MPPIVSYAQNGEDVVLHRALQHVEKGFYIDVGASLPDKLSVTKLFYELGWSGINIEPTKQAFDALVATRTRDVNLDLCISNEDGTRRFFEVADTGLSTLNPDAADAARRDGFAVTERFVQVRRLQDVYRECGRPVVHFLKIDVEGSEREVLNGMDFSEFRPWIIVCEATLPNESRRNDENWRDILERAGYECVLFDGLNLFFLANEHADMKELLSAPANVHDQFVRVDVRDAIAWNRSDAEAAVRRSMEDTVAWNRSDAEAAVRRSMDDTIAWHRSDAEAAAHRSMDDTIAWHRSDAEAAVRQSVLETIAWHRADAAQRAFTSAIDLSGTQLRAEAEQARRDGLLARDTAASLRRQLDTEIARSATTAGELDEDRRQYQAEIAELRHANADLSAWRDAVHRSTSWRVTRPLRVASRQVQRLARALRRL